MDTNEIIPHKDSRDVLWLSSAGGLNLPRRQDVLRSLLESWASHPTRQETPEKDYVVALSSYLQSVATARVLHVGDWIDRNLSRFSPEHIEIQNLQRELTKQSQELVNNLILCAMTCSDCALRCIEVKGHGAWLIICRIMEKPM